MADRSHDTELVHITTDDGVALDGALWTPQAASPTAIALFPGTGSEFYTPGLAHAGPAFAAAGYATLALNRRDHGTRVGFHTLHEAAMDHRYAVDFLAARRAENIVLGGHSFGTITVPYYIAETDDARVPALLLYAPLADLRPASVTICGGQIEYDGIVAEAERMVAAGRGGEAFLIPPMVPGGLPLVHSHEVFLDKRGPDARTVGAELIGHVGDRPLLGVRDPGDPFPATQPPARAELEAANPKLDYRLLDDIRDGATDPAAHGFAGREDEVVAITLDWLARNGLEPRRRRNWREAVAPNSAVGPATTAA